VACTRSAWRVHNARDDSAMIFILEDDERRVRRFVESSASVAPGLPVRVWRSARLMIADLPDCLEHARVISLDHDLNESPSDPADPGCGYDIAKLLAELIPCCPVIIHTSNGERGTWMEGECRAPAGDTTASTPSATTGSRTNGRRWSGGSLPARIDHARTSPTVDDPPPAQRPEGAVADAVRGGVGPQPRVVVG
jgi:hypothetical protein